MQWFVRPETVRLELGDGAWIEVKRDLTVKDEDAAVLAAAVKQDDSGITFDSGAWRRARVARYLVAWSLDGEPTKEAIDNLTQPGFAAIHAAITAHEDAAGGPEGNATTPTT